MSDTAIRVENLGKLYKIGALQRRHDTLRDRINDVLSNPLKKLAKVAKAQRNPIKRSPSFSSDDHIWALKDVSFEVNRGEVIGIIGRNGAGKTTLLKILSRITEPTEGRVEIRGRVGSLLEVGTGFHPELTGRENIYLNGAILGMKKTEIEQRFDEIVAFADIEKFLDTPVKRYSSGMYVRLAFAVAAHLEPEILLVDEVLAVGDTAFQKKCLGKMDNIAKAGRTVLFVSHNMAAINALCSRTIMLDQGNLIIDSPTNDAINIYLKTQPQLTRTPLINREDRKGDGRIRFTKVWIEDKKGIPVSSVSSGQDIRIVATYISKTKSPLGCLSIAFALYGPMGETITDLWNEGAGSQWEDPPHIGKIVCTLSRLPLKAGRYTFNVCGRLNQIIADWIIDAGVLEVEDGDFFGTGRLPGKAHGYFLIAQEWDLEELTKE